MKISPQHTGSLQPARQAEQAQRQRPQEVGTDRTRPSDRVQIERPERPADGASPSERVEALADKVSERLEHLAESTGADLSEVGAEFSQNIDRLLEGLADGSLSARDVANGISATLDSLSRGVQTNVERPELRSTSADEGRVDAASTSERLEGLAADVQSRLSSLAGELGLDGDQARDLASSFQGNIDRLLAGVADGTIGADALESGVQNILSQVAGDVQRTISEPTREGRETREGRDLRVADEATPPTSEVRFDDAVSSLEERLASVGEGLEGEQARAFAELEEAFQSAMDRLGDATFDGSLGRDEFQTLFQSLVSDLGEDLQGLLGGGVDQAEAASLYHPVTGIEQLDRGLPGGLDTTV